MKFAFLIEPPFNFLLADGSVVGCDVELARHVFDELGVDRFEPIETEFATLLPGLSEGRWRMTTGLFMTAEREETAAFSRPIWALPDGLLVAEGNPFGFSGYRSVAEAPEGLLAVIRDQVQHRSAIENGVPTERILTFETYADAAAAVEAGQAAAYASVARAHAGFLSEKPDQALEFVGVPEAEKAPAFGCYGFAKADTGFRAAVDEVLDAYLGSAPHRAMMARYGFSDAEIDCLPR